MGTADVVVIGAGPAGVMAALRAADLGARTTLVTRDAFGGMAANDGPVPVRTLAHAARLIRGARELDQYGIHVSTPVLDYARLLLRVREVIADVSRHSALREQVDCLGIDVHEYAGSARFAGPDIIETVDGRQMRAGKIILCTGGTSRRLRVPGADLTATHSDAWSLEAIPESMIVVGAGMTGVQIASIFQTFGSQVDLFQAARRILPSEDEDVSAEVATAFRTSGMRVHENFGAISSFERSPRGLQMIFSKDGVRNSVEASLAVTAIGWVADTAQSNLPIAGVELDERGYVRVDAHMRTSAPHIYAAGDVTGRWMLVPQAMHDGWLAATNAVRGDVLELEDTVAPIGGFSEPEYARVGLTEAQAREAGQVVVAKIRFDETTRTIIDRRTQGFCKLVVDRASHAILGCHVVGERAVEIVQVAAIAMSSGARVEMLARIPFSFPTYTGILGRVAYRAAEMLGLEKRASHPLEGASPS